MGRLDETEEQGDRKEDPKAIQPVADIWLIHVRKRSKFCHGRICLLSLGLELLSKVIHGQGRCWGGFSMPATAGRRLARALAPIDRHHEPATGRPISGLQSHRQAISLR
jgi:hypothetical protein